MCFKTLICAMILYNHNLSMIKWNAYGTELNRIRSEAEKCSSTMEAIFRWRYQEAISIDFEFPSYEEVLSVLSESEKDFLHFEESRRFSDVNEVLELCYTMMKDLVECTDSLDPDSDEYKFITSNCKELKNIYAEYKRMNIEADEHEEYHDDEEPEYIDFDSDEEDDLSNIDLDFDIKEPENDSPEVDDGDLSDLGFPISED